MVILLYLITEASPADASINPVRMEIVVVFPAPLCPKSANICPWYIVNESPSTAFLPLGYTLERFRIFRL